jgi:hypothetical protein
MAEISNVEHSVGGYVGEATTPGDPAPSDTYYKAVRAVNQSAWVSSRVIWSGTESPGGSVELSRFAKALGGATAFGILGSSLSMFNTVDNVHHNLRQVASHVPLAGNPLASLVDHLFLWKDVWRTNLIHDGAYYGARAAVNQKTMVDTLLHTPSGPTGSSLDARIKQFVEPVHREADTLWAWLQYETERINHLAHQAGLPETPVKAPTGGNVIPLNEQVHSLQARVEAIEDTQNALAGRIRAFQAQVEALQDQFEALSTRIHGVRAVNVGFQDIENQIAALQRQLTHLEGQVQPQITANTQNIASVAPLAVLAVAGARGIDNLRRLEDNPCQCPKLNLPDYLAEALAAYEFVTNG